MTDTVGKAGRREWIGLMVLALPCMLLAMDLTVLHLAVPALSADLHPSSAQLLWIVDIYGFLIAGSLITMGTLGDRIGRRKLLLIGAAAFGAASALAGFSKSAEMLIATRALLGVAGATLMPSTLALIRNMFHDPAQRTVAIAVWLNSFMIGSAVGPLLGGLMLEKFWWGSVFLLNVPIMVLLLILGPMLLPESRDPNSGRLDLLSAGMSLTGMLSVIYGIKQTAQDGFGTNAAIGIIIGIALGTAFVIRQKKLEHPLIDLRLFEVPAFSASVCTQLVALTGMAGIFLFSAQYMQLVLGLSPLQAGLWMLPGTAAGMMASMVTPAAARRFRPSYVMGTGLVIAAIGMSLLTQVGSVAGLTLLIVSFVVMSLGMNPAMTLTTDMIMTVAPPDRAGAASAISETSAELGLALGMAILGSVGTAAYRRTMTADDLADIPVDAAETSRATLGGAVEAGARVGGTLGQDLTQTARDAFSQALETVAMISTAMLLAMAIVAVVLLRNIQPKGAETSQSDIPVAA